MKSFPSWHTTKVENGFKFTVQILTPTNEIQPDGTYCINQLFSTGVKSSRAIAKTEAQKICKQLRVKLQAIN